MFVVKLLQKP